MDCFSKLLISLLLFAFHTSAIEVCIDNSHIQCSTFDTIVQCHVRSSNGTAVSDGIFTCSHRSTVLIYVSTVASIQLDLRISDSEKVLFISETTATSTVISLYASSVSASVISILHSNVIFNFTGSTNFTEYFPNLSDVNFKNPIYSELPNFSENDKLTSITVTGAELPIGGDHVISIEFISGLAQLRKFEWTDSSITSIIPRAFSNLPQLSSLKLSNNNINHLRQFTFQGEHLPTLYYLWLIGNNISQVDDLAFDSLVLNTLYLDSNPSFPLQTLVNITSLQSLTLANNGYTYLSPGLFYNLDFQAFNLKDNPFNCTCDLQWTNIAQIFLSFVGAICYTPVEFRGLAITNSTPYANCVQSSSYQCFNHSILCMGSSQCTNTVTSAFCSCAHIGANYGYSQIARDCIILIDECAEGNSCDQICADTLHSYKCSCTEGYLAQGTRCLDVNECLDDNGGCHQECNNSMGSFECGCSEGFQMNTDTTCIDINECFLNNGDCDQKCTNVNGSYFCSCYNGYTMNQTCTNVNGSYLCSCYNGYTLNQTCTTVNGSYFCSCYNGYTMNQTCTNVNGSYFCSCYNGYTMNQTCIDIDECESDVCQYGCENSMGSYECGCSPGYNQVGTDGEIVCEDLNECATSNGNCPQYCFNTKGSYYCACYIGYEMNVATSTCIDIDECTVNNPCDQICINNLGGYTCRCMDNYVKVAHGVFVNCTESAGGVDRVSHFLLLVVLLVFIFSGMV